MSKQGGSVARSIVAMLIWRKRRAWEAYLTSVKTTHGEECDALWATRVEAHNAAELARRMLYNNVA